MRPSAGGVKPVVVLAHVHYPEIWADIAALLAARMSVPFRLVATTTGVPEDVVLPGTPLLIAAEVLPVENRGRDILPFLRAMRAAAPFDIGIKIHTKKSPQRPDGGHWRTALLDTLVPGPDGVHAIVQALRADERIGFVPPARFALSVEPWLLQNRAAMDRVLAASGTHLDALPLDGLVFAAGSMFWFRREAFEDLAVDEVEALFEPEDGQVDGTTAHAMERLFPVAAARRGLVSLPTTALADSRPGMPLAALRALAVRDADVPTTFFPAPYVEALPFEQSTQPTKLPAFARWVARLALPLATRRRLSRFVERLWR